MEKKVFVNEIDTAVATPEEVRKRMEVRAKRSIDVVERRAALAVAEIDERAKEYKWLLDGRIEQMKGCGAGLGANVKETQEKAESLKNEIAALAAKARNGIAGRIERFRDGVAVVRIEVDADILTPEAACSFMDQVHRHAILTGDRIDGDFADADAGMRRHVNQLETMF